MEYEWDMNGMIVAMIHTLQQWNIAIAFPINGGL